ncbi:uncharacterized protein LOC131229263 [Magnolia sinica]|uniref:uncharacterized protein LOC131229263 n=1 Tax=Magnolia sinica TaxID=86752 RepID=UPI0026592726|nr:uncharacterized protein LOC131229263 [Magnolia sinica]
MSSGRSIFFLRNASSSSSSSNGRFSFHGGLFSHRSLLSPPTSAPILTKQLSRAYVRSHLRFKKHIESELPPSVSPKKIGLVGWYLGMIEARPVLTKGVTAGIIFTGADVSSQMITLTSSDSYDPIRTLRMAGYGMLISGPSLHLWFNFVSRILPKRDLLSTLKKMFMGQTVYGPLINATFFSVNAVLQGENGAEIVARLKRDMIPTTLNGLVYWPICDFITFKFIPVRLQPLVSNSFSFIWSIYITYMASLKKVSMDKIPTD